MSKEKIIAILIIIVVLFGIYSIISSILAPPKAEFEDSVFEDIGDDQFLNVTLKSYLKLDEKDISDGSFETSSGIINYYDAKNITCVDTLGFMDYFIVWKTTPDKYEWVDTNNKVNQYISCYLTGDVEGKCFVEYSFENNYVYGVMVCKNISRFSESHFLYDTLGLDSREYQLAYTSNQASFSSGSSHYHTVVPDRYTLSRTDPGAYYDHYEYGDNYAIDDYLESQGYD